MAKILLQQKFTEQKKCMKLKLLNKLMFKQSNRKPN